MLRERHMLSFTQESRWESADGSTYTGGAVGKVQTAPLTRGTFGKVQTAPLTRGAVGRVLTILLIR